jgi:hypothetical protein
MASQETCDDGHKLDLGASCLGKCGARWPRARRIQEEVEETLRLLGLWHPRSE